MLLAIDIGNTNTVLGLYEGEKLKADWRIATYRAHMFDEYGVLFKNLFELKEVGKPQKAIISSVVPPVEQEIAQALKIYWQIESAIVSNAALKAIIAIETDRPQEVGVDMLVNAVAAFDYDAKSIIVVDFGTATTFNLLLKPNRFLGAVIAPGPRTAADALALQTAKLPRIDLVPPQKVIGTNTTESMQSGIVLGHASMVEGMVARIAKEFSTKPLVIATGGFSIVLKNICQAIDICDPLLTLKGLQKIDSIKNDYL